MPLKVMLSKGGTIQIADELGLTEIEVLMHGTNRVQLAIHADKEVRKIAWNDPNHKRKPKH